MIGAAITGDSQAVKRLLDQGHLPQRAKHKTTPLFLAAGNGHSETVRILLEHGASHRPNPDGNTPLANAVLTGNTECVRLLLKYGATQEPNEIGMSPLVKSCWGGYHEITRLLLEAGGNPNGSERCMSPFLDTAKSGDFDTWAKIGLFLEYGADPFEVESPVRHGSTETDPTGQQNCDGTHECRYQCLFRPSAPLVINRTILHQDIPSHVRHCDGRDMRSNALHLL